jgi:hypothetical protein
MRIGLIDVDAESRGKVTFPNLPLMKISAWHKAQGDTVGWYLPFNGTYDRVYMAKVFGDEYTRDYPYQIDAMEIIRGGSGYAISVVDGKETYDKSLDKDLPPEIDHIYPDYSLYKITDTAYGFLTKGCPRGCDFCHVKSMQGRCTYTFARLSEFWRGQKNISLLDPNLTASKDYETHMADLIASKAHVDFTQGLDIRFLTAEKIALLKKVRWKMIHFAWDRPEEDLEDKFHAVSEALIGDRKSLKQKCSVYVLTNFNSTFEQDLHRINVIRDCGMQPYVMIYRKETAPTAVRQLQRWCSPYIFWKVPSFEEYKAGKVAWDQ